MGIQEYIIKNIGMPLMTRVKGWPVTRYLRELEESQWWTAAQLAEMQNEKLRAVVRHAYETVQYYRELLDSIGLKPDDIKSVADLPKIPILTKDAVKANYPDRMASNLFRAKDVVECSSSGSTGVPLKYWTSLEEKGLMWGCIYRWRRWAGWDLGRKYVSFSSVVELAFKSHPTLASLEKKLTRVLVLDDRSMSRDNVGDYVRAIAEFDPCMVKGYPSTCYYLADYMRERDIKLRLPTCVCNGETLYPFMREVVEQQFGCGIYDNYGSEGIETAGQCHPTSQYHISSESVICEIVDDDGNAAPAGTEGRLVVTSLGKWAMPFLRYDTQDIATMSDARCSCGRGLPLLESVKGRVADRSRTPSGKTISVYTFAPLLAAKPRSVEHWQFVHESPGELVISIVPYARLEKSVEHDIIAAARRAIDDDIEVRIDYVDHIEPAPTGKRMLFVSKLSRPN